MRTGRMNVAVAGWAGAGKTVVAGTLARVAAAGGADVLAVDDDPTETLAVTLGVGREADVAPLPEDLLNRVRASEREADFVLAKPPGTIIDDYGVAAPADVTLLKLAEVEHETDGVNSSLLTARKILAGLVRERDEVTVVDGVAAVKHLPPDAVAAVDVLLVVVEPHYKSVEVGRRTVELAADLGFPEVRVVANKVHDGAQRTIIEDACASHDLELGAVVPFDEAVHHALQDDRAPIDDAPETAAVRAIGTLVEDLTAVDASGPS